MATSLFPSQRFLLSAAVACSMVVAGCGGGSTPTPVPVPISLSVGPTTANVLQSATQTFTATVVNTSNTTVTWSVQDGNAGGTAVAPCKYTAPNAACTLAFVRNRPTETT